MPKSTLGGHPLHPQLITAPAALLPFSLIMDVMHLRTGDETYAHVAHHTMQGGVIGGLAAAAAGAMDYLEIPQRTHTKRLANVHAGLNVGAMALFGANLWMRRKRRVPSGVVPTLLSAVGAGALLASAWYGGHMVYEHGVRVKGVDPIGGAEEANPPLDDRVERLFDDAAEHAPERGPELRS